jgi:hypothetical protein
MSYTDSLRNTEGNKLLFKTRRTDVRNVGPDLFQYDRGQSNEPRTKAIVADGL